MKFGSKIKQKRLTFTKRESITSNAYFYIPRIRWKVSKCDTCVKEKKNKGENYYRHSSLKGIERNYALASGCSLRLLAVRVMDK